MLTPMRVIKVIVDELPPDCYSCKYMKRTFKCDLTMNKITDRDYDVERPSHCPLQLERTCENCEHYGKATKGYCDNICGICGIAGRDDYCSKWKEKE